jgi:hypothetical protein
MRDLVHDRPPDLVGDLVLGPAQRADRLTVDGDPVGQHAGILGRPAGEGDALVEPEQAGRARAVLHRHRDIAHQPPESRGQPVKRRGDHLFETLWIHLDH